MRRPITLSQYFAIKQLHDEQPELFLLDKAYIIGLDIVTVKAVIEGKYDDMVEPGWDLI